jgi:hypothetical protein
MTQLLILVGAGCFGWVLATGIWQTIKENKWLGGILSLASVLYLVLRIYPLILNS